VTRVLLSTDAVGGAWQYSLELARGLRGITVDLAVLGPPPSAAQAAEARSIPGLELHGHEGRLEWMDDPWADVDDAGRWLVDLAQRQRADLVHLGGYSHAAAGFRVPTLVVAHSCVLSWWRAVHGTDAPPSYDTYRARVAAGLAAATTVVAPTAAMRAALRRHHPISDIVVIHNGFDRAPLMAPKTTCVLSAGRLWDHAKNMARLGRVARRLPWPVRLAGPLTADAGAATCLGTLAPAEMAAEYARAAIYAAPALYEPFGLAILEAAAAGCALVLGDIPSLRELWTGAALFVDPNDEEALCRVLLALIEAESLRQQLGAAAAAHARRYDSARMCDAYRRLYAGMGGAWEEPRCAS
jgi:glycosyltransferase involved in cell wall biosynthesis